MVWLLLLLFCCVNSQMSYETIHPQLVKREPIMSPPNLLEKYDFIVVGAGPAGSVVANRLTENPHWKVLLLEAGTTENGSSEIPAISIMFPQKDNQWNFKTEKSRSACLGQPDQSCTLTTGKAVGGGTVINAMIYTRGNQKDYDTWHKLGNEGWSYEEILPYFLKSEDIQIPELQSSPYHSNNGNLTVEHPVFQIPLDKIIFESGEELTLPYTDYNGAEPIGVAKIQSTKRKGRRVSAFKAFLEPITTRSNLHIRQNTTVTRILIDPATKTAYGVEFVEDNNTISQALAKNEVILSAGAIMSPILLMHSGIGHQGHLKDMGIPVIQNLPVGDYFQDHLAMTGLTFLINNFSLSVNYPKDVFPNLPKLVEEFESSGDNVLSSVGAQCLAYIKSSTNSSDSYPDFELLFLNTPNGVQFSDTVYSTVYKPIENKPQYTIWPILLKPKSRGNIRLMSSDRTESPNISTNYLTHDEDVEMMVEAIKWSIRMSETEAFKKIGSRLHDTPIPGCESFTFASDPYWGCVVRHLSTTMYHYSGTCRMGSTGNPTAVVDPRLRVHGVNRLRVVDTSIIPEITSSHTAAVAYMIGEKAADMIKEDWNLLLKL